MAEAIWQSVLSAKTLSPPPPFFYSSIKILGSAATGSDMCVNPGQSLPSPLLVHSRAPTHRGAEAAATHGAPELPKGLPGSAGGVEALGQQHDAVEEEKRGQAVDDILEILNAEKDGGHR